MSREIDELMARLTRMEEVESARNFLHTYAATMDRPDPDAAAALFAEHGELSVPSGTCHGRAEIRDFYARVWERDKATKRHFLVSPRTDWLEPGLVRVRSYFLWTGQGADASMLGWGTYDDTIDVSGPSPVFVRKAIDPHVATTLDQGWAQ